MKIIINNNNNITITIIITITITCLFVVREASSEETVSVVDDTQRDGGENEDQVDSSSGCDEQEDDDDDDARRHKMEDRRGLCVSVQEGLLNAGICSSLVQRRLRARLFASVLAAGSVTVYHRFGIIFIPSASRPVRSAQECLAQTLWLDSAFACAPAQLARTAGAPKRIATI